MRLLVKAKRRNKEPQRIKKGISASGAAFLGVGVIGLFVFGYEIFQAGGLTSLTGMASGVGLIASVILILAGVYMK